MTEGKSSRALDLLVIAAANLFNLVMVVIFYARTRSIQHPVIFGALWGVLILLFGAAGILNLKNGREWWSCIMPLIMALFLTLELILDYILQIDFRGTNLIIPYLILYYGAILGMIGYAFLRERKLGSVTLLTYFLSQAAAIYSYIQVGHG